MKRDQATGATVPVSLPEQITESELNKVRELAMQTWKERINKEYNAEQWTTLCYVLATWAVFGAIQKQEKFRAYESVEDGEPEYERKK